MLLPKSEQVVQEDEDEDEIDPRWELVHQLLEYKKFKEAANDLDTLIQFQQNLMPREVSGKQRDRSPRPLKKSDKMELWGAFNQVLRRLSDRLVVGEIEDENVTVSDRMEYIIELSMSKPGEPLAFTALFEKRTTLVLIMYTFLACLELARLAKLRIWQDETYTEIYFEAIPEIDLETDDTPIDGSEDAG